jgi:DNA-binding MarR family transcriptional regulator
MVANARTACKTKARAGNLAKKKAPTKAPTPPPLQAHLGFWLRFVSNPVSMRFQQLLEAKDVSVSEWVAMRTLWSRNETTHADLIAAMGMTKGATSKVVSRLEQKGLAKRQRAGGQIREQVLVLTAAGRSLLPLLAALADANDEHFFGHLRANERRALMRTLQALVQHHQMKDLPTA